MSVALLAQLPGDSSLWHEAYAADQRPEPLNTVESRGNAAPTPGATLPPAPTPLPTLTASPRVSGSTAGMHQAKLEPAPARGSFDFARGLFDNSTDPVLIDGTPWDNGSTNFVQYQLPGGGTSYWDYWIENEPWDSPNHLWKDERGQWRTYEKQVVSDSKGRPVNAYILVDRPGPGVMDKLWFTHNPVRAFLRVIIQKDLFWSPDPPEVTDWGSLARLGNLLIQVDDRIVYDGPIQSWYSGQAQNLPTSLQGILVWRYGQFGSDGNIVPIPYQKRIRVAVYGGPDKPKWFMATGLTLEPGTLVKPYTGDLNDLQIDRMSQLAGNLVAPENFIDSLGSAKEYSAVSRPDEPVSLLLQGSGTLAAFQLRVPKRVDLAKLTMQVQYDGQVGIDLPLLAFFGDPEKLVIHRSSKVGIIESGGDYLFYSNYRMPYQNDMQIQLATDGQESVPIQIKAATTSDQFDTQLRVLYRPPEKQEIYGPDYQVSVNGEGKVVGLVLTSRDQGYDSVPKVIDSKTGNEDDAKRKWPMGYLEGNLTMTDGAGNTRYYSGQEDWAEGGYYFNSGYTTPPGGSNRPFAGIFQYKEGSDGYATLFRYFSDISGFPFRNGLTLLFGHGTWRNNFPVTYGVTLYYYSRVQ